MSFKIESPLPSADSNKQDSNHKKRFRSVPAEEINVRDVYPKIYPMQIGFKKHGESGAWVCDLLPWTAKIVDEISIVKTCKAELFNHAPAKLFMNTGSGQFGRPSMGSWVSYGLGTENDSLPAFLTICPTLAHGGVKNWGAAFLPASFATGRHARCEHPRLSRHRRDRRGGRAPLGAFDDDVAVPGRGRTRVGRGGPAHGDG